MVMEGSFVKGWYIRLSCRKHQIPSASVRQRPQPRQPEYLEPQSKNSPQFPNSGLIPRSNIPHPVTPPDRRPPEQRVGGRDGILTAPSFTFLPSTVNSQCTIITTVRSLAGPHTLIHILWEDSARDHYQSLVFQGLNSTSHCPLLGQYSYHPQPAAVIDPRLTQPLLTEDHPLLHLLARE